MVRVNFLACAAAVVAATVAGEIQVTRLRASEASACLAALPDVGRIYKSIETLRADLAKAAPECAGKEVIVDLEQRVSRKQLSKSLCPEASPRAGAVILRWAAIENAGTEELSGTTQMLDFTIDGLSDCNPEHQQPSLVLGEDASCDEPVPEQPAERSVPLAVSRADPSALAPTAVTALTFAPAETVISGEAGLFRIGECVGELSGATVRTSTVITWLDGAEALAASDETTQEQAGGEAPVDLRTMAAATAIDGAHGGLVAATAVAMAWLVF